MGSRFTSTTEAQEYVITCFAADASYVQDLLRRKGIKLCNEMELNGKVSMVVLSPFDLQSLNLPAETNVRRPVLCRAWRDVNFAWIYAICNIVIY